MYKKRDNDYINFFKKLFNNELPKMRNDGYHINNYIDSIIYNKYNL